VTYDQHAVGAGAAAQELKGPATSQGMEQSFGSAAHTQENIMNHWPLAPFRQCPTLPIIVAAAGSVVTQMPGLGDPCAAVTRIRRGLVERRGK
jgi:hypothetical protein